VRIDKLIRSLSKVTFGPAHVIYVTIDWRGAVLYSLLKTICNSEDDILGMTFQRQANQAISASGGRMTSQRQLLIELLEATPDYIDAEQLFQLASQQDASLSLVTVYRTLHMLEEAGLVTPQYLSREHDRKYYRAVTGEERFHFTCRRCQRVIPFYSALTERIKSEIEARLDVEVFGICMCIDGLCAACREEETT
jgi:Fur family transcriptional regulator, ferric uptake regulator